MKLVNLFAVNTDATRLTAMEGLRAYAAIIVYILHMLGQFVNSRLGINFDKTTLLELSKENPEYLPFYWLWSSHYGVDIFFLLSGYLIVGMVNKKDFHYGRFIFHRFLRIYPTLIVSTLMYVLYGMIVHGEAFWLGGVVGNLLLLNGISGLNFPAINVVTWSLFFEFSFYFIFPILWRLCRRDLAKFTLLILIILIPLLFISPSYMRYLMFVAGVFLKVISESNLSKIRSIFTEWQIIIIYLISTLLFVYTKNYILFISLYFFTSFLFVDRALNFRGALYHLLSLRVLRFFGNISFSFYLFHPLGLIISKSVLFELNIQNNYSYLLLFFIISLIITTIISTACFVLIEQQYFKNKKRFDFIFNYFFRSPKIKPS
ncbi:MAG: acyltransferase [Candidatus Nitrotoga sp.]